MKRLLAIALALAGPIAAALPLEKPSLEARSTRGCGGAYYRNSRGHCVHRPVRGSRRPAGASARCRDGSYSFSQSRRGTCSWHGGVATWY